MKHLGLDLKEAPTILSLHVTREDNRIIIDRSEMPLATYPDLNATKRRRKARR